MQKNKNCQSTGGIFYNRIFFPAMHWRSCCESAIHVHGKPQAGIERHGSIITQHSHSIVHIFWTQLLAMDKSTVDGPGALAAPMRAHMPLGALQPLKSSGGMGGGGGGFGGGGSFGGLKPMQQMHQTGLPPNLLSVRCRLAVVLAQPTPPHDTLRCPPPGGPRPIHAALRRCLIRGPCWIFGPPRISGKLPCLTQVSPLTLQTKIVYNMCWPISNPEPQGHGSRRSSLLNEFERSLITQGSRRM